MSKLPVGSSAKIIWGSLIIALAIATHNRFFAKKADYLLEMRAGSIKSLNAWVSISKF